MRHILASTALHLPLLITIFIITGLANVQNIFIRSSTGALPPKPPIPTANSRPTTSSPTTAMSSPLNVLRQPLQLFSRSPPTGFYRDGYCRTGAADFGNHAVAGVVSEKFLDFTASQGNDLRVAGLSEGCKWCLCTSRWLEAFQAWKDGRIEKEAVPRVQLSATEDSVLRRVGIEDLRMFAVREEGGANGEGVNGASGTNGVNGVH
jgi:uncharacterized protein